MVVGRWVERRLGGQVGTGWHRGLAGALVAAAVAASVRAGLAEWRWYADEPTGVALVLMALAGLAWALAGAVLAWLRPTNVVGWLMLVVGTLTQVSVGNNGEARLAQQIEDPTLAGRPLDLTISVIGGLLILAMLGLLPLLYPSGRLAGRTDRVLAALVVAGAAAFEVQVLAAELDPSLARAFGDDAPNASAGSALVVWVPLVVFALACAAGWVSAVVRLVRSPAPERQQLTLLLTAVVVALVTTPFAGPWGQVVGLYLLPVAVAVGILRYRLLDIEVTRPADPVAAVSHLGSVLANSDPAHLLDAAVGSIHRSLRPSELRLTDRAGTVIASVGSPAGTAPGAADPTDAPDPAWLAVPLVVSGEDVGHLRVATYPGGSWSRRRRRLAGALAPQLAVAVRAVELGEDLQHQRDAVVEARREERERLRHDLHDGLGPALTGIGLGLQAVQGALARGDVTRADELTDVLRGQTANTVVEVRRIIEDLRPAALSTDGLAGALPGAVAALARTVPIRVEVGDLPALPAPVEDAVFRVALEAVTNLERHSAARSASLAVWAEAGDVHLMVGDDGRGLAADAAPGVGLGSMRRRADAVGARFAIESSTAGTTVTMSVPLGRRAGSGTATTAAELAPTAVGPATP
ncbi:hypothetical protein EXU48_11290 [Occultella glacieicola]|uniref:Histidine kinase/HSP90-like ATPase domain-containing protein n=1 Tax=Occultella glacieicola TaxID=2518684 RepID=A0ABY2E4J8_9MICO|nr:histidine kinase [Occultella glacieicola]TDE94035.1 hypothetical protein EXU48_11290 [Occultella glacieicola]